MSALRIGITGPIGCGKSTIAGWLAESGARIVDADVVARAVTERGGPAHAAVVERFGPSVVGPDGGLDRAALGRIVFADQAALRDLEAIVHPAVRPAILGAIADADAAGVAIVVIEAIRLVESGLGEVCDETWLVTCEPATQRDRLRGRGMDPDDQERRIATQGDLVARLRPRVTRVIGTDGDPDETMASVQAALAEALTSIHRMRPG